MTKRQAPIDSKELATIAIEEIDNRKGEDILLMDLREVDGAITDFFVICSANSTTQVGAIKDAIERKLRTNAGEKPWHIEGTSQLEWVLMDYVNVVIHIFLPERRDFYNLEELWADAKIKEIKTVEN